jgi:O-antigen ligase
LTDQHYLRFRPNYEQTIYHGQLGDHIEATYAMKDLSTAERFYRWIAGWRMGRDHLLTGVGPNHFYPAYRSYTVESFRTYVSDNPERSTVHNYFLLLLAEQGLPALLLFLFTVISMLMTAQRLYSRSKGIEKQIALVVASVVAMITVLISPSDLIETDKIGSIFYLCAGVLVAAASGSYVERIPEPVAEKIE